MDINISNKIIIGAAIAAGLAVIGLAGSVYIMGFESVLAFFYEIFLDIFENFLRLPERKIV